MIALGHPARLVLQAAEFFTRYGTFGPFEIASPLLQVLLWAGQSCFDSNFEAAETAVRIGAYAGGCAAVIALARGLRREPAAVAWVAAAYCAAPSKLYALLEGAGLNELLFWSLAAVCGWALEGFRRRPTPLRFLASIAAGLALVSARAWTLTLWDAVFAAELLVIAGVLLYQPLRVRWLTALPLLGATFLLAETARSTPSLPPPPNRLVRIAGSADLQIRLNPVLAAVNEKVFSVSSTERAEEALLWARAMGAHALWTPARSRFAGLLEALATAGDSALFDLGGRNPGDAAIVSRYRWRSLPAIRGVYDREALEQYLIWADRPESLRVRTESGALTVRARLSGGDAVLVRVPFAGGWELLSGGGRLFPDPIGYTVFVPEADVSGEMQIEIAPENLRASLPEPAPLHARAFPMIAPGGLAHGVKLTPPPFEAGDVVSIFGSNFLPGKTLVWIDRKPVEVLHSDSAQINIKLPAALKPGKYALVVESGGLRGFARSIEVRGQ